MAYLTYFSQFSGFGLWFLQFAVGVIFIYHGWPKFKKWNIPFSSQSTTGWEFDLILLAVNIFLLTR